MVATALLMGFAGSLHCVSMCGPLAMAVTQSNARVVLKRLLYHSGRILTYACIGTIVASIGYLLPISRFQNLFSILLGTLLLLAGMGLLKVNSHRIFKPIGNFSALVKAFFSQLINKKNWLSVLLLGALNGLLPCGLVLIALSYCLTLSSPIEGFAFMAFFGAGTLPAMLGFMGILPVIIRKLKFNVRYVTSGMLLLSGVLLIARVLVLNHSQNLSIKQGLIDTVLCR